MDENVKQDFDNLCNELGMNMTTAFNIFAKTVIRQRKIPFEISLDIPNAETLEAMQEIIDMKSRKIPKDTMSVEDFIKEM